MSDIVIRPITQGDIDSFWATLDSVAREKKFLARDEAPPIESTRDFVGQNIAAGHPHFVAVDGADVIGWCDVLPRDDSDTSTGVLGMGLHKNWRGKGLGKKLICTALAAAQAKNFTAIRLDVNVDNLNAIALYEKVGFAHTRTYSKPDKPEKQMHDMLWRGFQP